MIKHYQMQLDYHRQFMHGKPLEVLKSQECHVKKEKKKKRKTSSGGRTEKGKKTGLKK